MRNYMFERMAGASAQPARTRRGLRRTVAAASIFAVVILSLVVLVLVFRHLEGSIWDHVPQDGGDSGSYDSGDDRFGILPGQDDGSGEAPRTTIPRAPAGVGALMSTTEARGAVLSGTEVYHKVLPSIVSVRAFSGASISSGSGVVLSADGYIITNYHVIEGNREASVTLLTDGQTYRAALVGYYGELDIAVLKIDAQDLTPAEFGSSRSLEAGETVYAVGNPMGYLYGSITDGVVSAVERSINVGGYSMKLIQTSAALNSGNSGGALVNVWGQVVGITSAKIDPPSEVTTEALGLAIPISDVRRCVNSLLRTGEMENPGVGIMCRDWPEGDGVLVVEITPGGPAEAGGLLAGDVILAGNGVDVATVDELKDVIYDTGVGAQLRCTVLRDGERLELVFELYEM